MTNANDPFFGEMEDIYSDVCCALDVQCADVTEYDEERTFCETSEQDSLSFDKSELFTGITGKNELDRVLFGDMLSFNTLPSIITIK